MNAGLIAPESRPSVLAEAKRLVDNTGEVIDYACDCGRPLDETMTGVSPNHRFQVRWYASFSLRVCYSLEELRKKCREEAGKRR